MEITKHWLKESQTDKIQKKETKNFQYQIIPKYLIIHYTAGDTADSAITWFRQTPANGNPDKICAHIVIDIDGTITQLAPFNTRCNHAGYSNWDSRTGINEYSIGIEMVNPGFCEKLEDGTFRRTIGNNKDGTPIYKSYPATVSNKISKLNHKHKFWTNKDNHYWFKFTSNQITAVSNLSKLLIEQYQLTFVIGHEDISTGRKPDPGPAFPWSEFKKNIFGKDDNIGNVFLVKSNTDNFAELRIQADKKATSIAKLKNGYEVELIETYGQWCKVFLVNDIKEIKDGKQSIKIEGWVHSSLLIKK